MSASIDTYSWESFRGTQPRKFNPANRSVKGIIIPGGEVRDTLIGHSYIFIIVIAIAETITSLNHLLDFFL